MAMCMHQLLHIFYIIFRLFYGRRTRRFIPADLPFVSDEDYDSDDPVKDKDYQPIEIHSEYCRGKSNWRGICK